MSQVTDPVMLDSTGQIIVSKLQDVIDAINGGTIDPLTVTQNGTYTPSGTTLGYGPVVVNVSGGGEIESWDFTSQTPAIGTIRDIPLTISNITFGANGAVFDAANDYIGLGGIPSGKFTLAVDVNSMLLPTISSHQRFLMASDDSGLIYRSTSHQWEFYSYSARAWATSSGESDPAFFSGATVKAKIDENGYWHIYKNNVLWYEPDVPFTGTTSIRIGSNAYSMLNAVISGFRWS